MKMRYQKGPASSTFPQNYRIEKYGFSENQDYVSFTENSVKPLGGRPSQEFCRYDILHNG